MKTMIQYLLIFALLACCAAQRSPNADKIDDLFSSAKYSNDIKEDAKLDVLGLLKKYGYPAEVHNVVTDDGHILEIHRISGGRGNVTDVKRPVVFLMHGLLSSSADWIVSGPGKGFGYILADAGYDVWMGNARGNYYSRRHKTLNPNQAKFWEFSWHEIGHIDLATLIDYTIAKSGQPKIHYVGHSQGTTSFFVLTSTRPEYNAKFISMHAFAPVAFMKKITSPFFKLLSPFVNALDKLTALIGLNEFAPKSEFLAQVGEKMCKEPGIAQLICTNTLFLICGFSRDQLNTTMLPLFLGHTPAGASAKQFVHYGQGVKNGGFKQLDLGAMKNLKKYGSLRPPDYNLGLVTAPVALHYSDNDWLAHRSDVDLLFSALPRVIGKFRVPLASFNHLDFVWAKDADTLLYKRVVNLIKSFDYPYIK